MTEEEAMEGVPEKVMQATIEALIEQGVLLEEDGDIWIDTHAVWLLKGKDGSYSVRIVRA